MSQLKAIYVARAGRAEVMKLTDYPESLELAGEPRTRCVPPIIVKDRITGK